jgi:hypothetical protein
MFSVGNLLMRDISSAIIPSYSTANGNALSLSRRFDAASQPI